MVLKQKKEDNNLIIYVSGRLDTITAPELEKVIIDNTIDINNLVIDLKDLEYVSSAGLRVFLIAKKRMIDKGEMIIQNVQSDVMDIFNMTGFSDILTIK